MRIEALFPLAVVFVIAAFVMAMGNQMVGQMTESFCPHTWIDTDDYTAATGNGNNTFNNPVTGGVWGCCQTTNATDCLTWYTGRYSINASQEGSESIEEMSSWLPTLALVIIAAIIIGVLVTYLARGSKV